jgi:tetratricopeptide (TPR) repeat protein
MSSKSASSTFGSKFNYVPTVSNPGDQADLYDKQGHINMAHGEYKSALDSFQEALRIRERDSYSNDRNLKVAQSYRNIGAAYYQMENYQQAKEFHEKAYSIRKDTLGMENLITSDSLENLGVVYRATGDYSQAMSYLQKALEIRVSNYNRADNQVRDSIEMDIATSYYDIGTIYSDLHNYSKALENLEKALSIRSKYLRDGINNPRLAEIIMEIDALKTKFPQ